MCDVQLHFWLEETAYFKMPKGQEQELIGSKRSSLEKVEAFATNFARQKTSLPLLIGLPPVTCTEIGNVAEPCPLSCASVQRPEQTTGNLCCVTGGVILLVHGKVLDGRDA